MGVARMTAVGARRAKFDPRSCRKHRVRLLLAFGMRARARGSLHTSLRAPIRRPRPIDTPPPLTSPPRGVAITIAPPTPRRARTWASARAVPRSSSRPRTRTRSSATGSISARRSRARRAPSLRSRWTFSTATSKAPRRCLRASARQTRGQCTGEGAAAVCGARRLAPAPRTPGPTPHPAPDARRYAGMADAGGPTFSSLLGATCRCG